MEYVNLGRTGLKVSRICLGCMGFAKTVRDWHLDEAESRRVIQRAVELGITVFDTANMYASGESEEVLGRAIHALCQRDEVVIATKVYYPMRADVNGRGARADRIAPLRRTARPSRRRPLVSDQPLR